MLRKNQKSVIWTHMVEGKDYPQRAPTGRFQKGSSGNPRGRPRKEHSPSPPKIAGSLHEMTLLEAERLLIARENDESSKIPIKQALTKALYVAGLKGNAYAANWSLNRIDRAELIEAAEIAREHEYWKQSVETKRRRIAEAKAKGEPEPLILPHPDDIIIEPSKHVVIAGPTNQAELDSKLETMRLRDQLILQAALDRRCWPGPPSGDPLDGPSAADILSELLNTTLPKRMRMSADDRWYIEYRYDLLTKRELLKQTYQGWQKIRFGIARRGQLSKPMRWAKEFADNAANTFTMLKAKKSSGVSAEDFEPFVARLLKIGGMWMAPAPSARKPRPTKN